MRTCAQTLAISDTVDEFGSLEIRRQESFPDLRSIFHGKKYVGADMRAG